MYFTVRGPNGGGILRADMNGANMDTVFTNGLTYPNGLYLDLPGILHYKAFQRCVRKTTYRRCKRCDIIMRLGAQC